MKRLTHILLYTLFSSVFCGEEISTGDDEVYILTPFEVEVDEVPDNIEEYNKKLRNYGLEPLKENNSVRFLWLRNASDPMVFQVADCEEEVDLVAKTYDCDTETWQVWKKRTAKRSQHIFVLQQIDDYYGFFDMPFRQRELGDSGSEWYLEVVYNNKRHVVFRRSPKRDTKFYELGFMIIESMIDEPLAPIF